jgi:putative addiction module component (TIGR02574 family)
MSPSAKRVLEDALALPEDARTDLVEALIESLEAPAESPAEVEAAWTDEIARRLKDVETGAVKPIPWDEARKMIFGSRDDAPSR